MFNLFIFIAKEELQEIKNIYLGFKNSSVYIQRNSIIQSLFVSILESLHDSETNEEENTNQAAEKNLQDIQAIKSLQELTPSLIDHYKTTSTKVFVVSKN